MAALGSLTAHIILSVFALLWRGYVLTVLWVWFIVPTFGLPAITVPAAIGISLITVYLTRHYTKEPKESPAEEWTRRIFLAVSWPAVALLVGWIVQHWM